MTNSDMRKNIRLEEYPNILASCVAELLQSEKKKIRKRHCSVLCLVKLIFLYYTFLILLCLGLKYSSIDGCRYSKIL